MSNFSKRLVLIGDSIIQGGNRTVTGAVFSGSGTTGTISSGSSFVLGGKIYISSASATDDAWNGEKTIASVSASGATCTFINDTALTASPTPLSGFSGLVIGQDFISNERNFYALANGNTNFPFSEIINRAGSGRKSEHCLAKIAEVIALRPGAVGIQVGTNDCLTSVADATIKANIEAIVTKCLNIGALVFLHTLPPIGTTAAGYTTTIRNQAVRINQWIKSYARVTPGVLLIDVYGVTAAFATGEWLTNYHSDGVHPTSIAAHAVGNEITTVWQAIGLQASDTFVTSAIDCYDTDTLNPNIAQNPIMAGAGGTLNTGFTGTLPTSWEIQRWAGASVGVCSVVARADGAGNNISCAMSTTANNDQILIIQYISSAASRVTAGDALQLELELGMASSTAVKARNVALVYTAGGVDYYIYATAGDGSSVSIVNDVVLYRTPVWVFPVGLTITQMTIRVLIVFNGSETGTYTIGRVSLRKLSPSALTSSVPSTAGRIVSSIIG
jgi:lysophospholipase L1-like esterase